MTLPGKGTDAWQVELQQLREELQQMRAEQREMAKAIDQLVTTFKSLALHMGIAAEPYGKKEGRARSERDLPGFA